MALLETKSITKSFAGVKAVDDLSLQIEKSLITGIIGPNGSGKSTLINVLSGLLPFEKGTIIIDEEKLDKIKPYEAPLFGITRTFQDVRLFNQMTVLDNLLVVMTKKNIFGCLLEKHQHFYQKKAEEILEKIGLLAKKNELAIGLSYGQRKLLEIGRTLVINPDIFLFDEPFAGLFPQMVAVVSNLLKELRTEGKTVVLIEHNIDLIRELCDYIFVLDSGKLLAHGQPEIVLKKKEVLIAYLGE